MLRTLSSAALTLSIGLLVFGVTLFARSWQTAHTRPAGIEGQRLKAMSEAAKKGESTYRFKTSQIPPPLAGR